MRRRVPLVALLAASATLIAALSIAGCGIDTFVYLYPVNQLLNSPSESDMVNDFYKFKTSDEDNSSSVYFKGFDVYYRIYNDTNVRASDVTAINAYNDANPTTALMTLVNTYKYARMVYSGRTNDIPLIKGASKDRVISIRLNDFQGIYKASLSEDGSNDGSGSLGVPLRTLNDGTKTDSFEYDSIQSGDDDVRYTSSSGDGTWYVQAYVVAYGYDESYKPYYSSLFNISHAVVKKP
jgi:hypothetical protein